MADNEAYSVTVDDIRERQARLEREIVDAIAAFQRDTDVSISNVDVRMVPSNSLGRRREWVVGEVNVSLDL